MAEELFDTSELIHTSDSPTHAPDALQVAGHSFGHFTIETVDMQSMVSFSKAKLWYNQDKYVIANYLTL